MITPATKRSGSEGRIGRAAGPASQIEQDPRWAAIVAREPATGSDFVYAVKTTGIYCRPGSASRLPHPRNVELFDTPQAAEAAGYRPSKRARDDRDAIAAEHVKLIAAACRQIESADTAPTLNELADKAGLSPYHFHRVFKSTCGLTPKAYAAAHRAGKLRKRLGAPGNRRIDNSITTAIYDAGFNSNGRFYETSDRMLGMRPKDYRAGGAHTDIRFAVGQCSLGAILVGQGERGICAIELGDDADTLVHDFQDRFPHANLIGGDRGFEQLVAKVVGFVESPSLGLDLPLDVRGTAFQERVWQALRDIPAGATASYADIARRIGKPKAIRAVAQACGANPVAVAIPCHRIIRSDGEVSGYHWGVERKRKLLERERQSD